jgi:putative endonuclease
METSRKVIGNMGETIAAVYLERHGFKVIGRNIARKTGELDIVAKKAGTLHIVEVKTMSCAEFPGAGAFDRYDPADNLHTHKIHKVARTAEWYVANIGWEGDWQVDGALVWIRERDKVARIRYLPQIL